MIVRELKLKLTKEQEKEFEEYLWKLTGLYNWAIRTIEINTKNKIYLDYNYLQNITVGNAKKIGIHSQVFQDMLSRACDAWGRCYKKISGRPHLKGIRNKLKSFTFTQFKNEHLKEKKINLPNFGEIRYFKQEIPKGKIKTVQIKKKASGWYAILVIDSNYIFPVKENEEVVGIDTGFKSLAVLSTGKKYENPRNYIKSQNRLAQAQRGKDKKLVSRIQERNSNRRKDNNHKVSREIVVNFKYIAITNDNLKGQASIFGKSIGDAGIGQLRNFIIYKGGNHGREVKLVDSRYTTSTCSGCKSLTGPTGLSGLAVREWVCSVCGTHHDRDINSGMIVSILGFGTNLKQSCKSKLETPSFRRG